MRDRIQFALVVVLCLSVLGFMGFFYQQLQNSNRSMMETNKAIIAALKERPTAAEELFPSVEIRVTELALDGPPIVGLDVTLRGKAFNEDTTTIREITDDSGVVTFGPVRAGSYDISYLNSASGLRGSQRITLYSGEGRKIIPAVAPGSGKREILISIPSLRYERFPDQAIILDLNDMYHHDSSDTIWERRIEAVIEDSQLFEVENTTDSQFRRMREYRNNAPWTYKKSNTLVKFAGNHIRVINVRGVLATPNAPQHDFSSYRQIEMSDHQEFVAKLDIDKDDRGYPLTLKHSGDFHELRLPRAFVGTYTYPTRSKLSSFGGLNPKAQASVRRILMNSSGIVVNDVRQIPFVTTNESLGASGPAASSNEPGLPITAQNGIIFSTEEFPKSIANKGTTLLHLEWSQADITESKKELGFYRVLSPLDFTNNETPMDIFRSDDRPFHTISARDMKHMTAAPFWFGVDKWRNRLDGATGIMIKWTEETSNKLNLRSAEFAKPMWIVLNSFEDIEAE